MNDDEPQAFVSACKKVAHARLVAALATMLVPTQQEIWWYVVDALTKIDTDDAAKALQPHLLQETNLQRELEIAEFLGRHGIRDGYPYAIEHMSEPYLREQAISALAAIREPRAVGELRKILEMSNDIAWNSAAVRALGILGASELCPSFWKWREIHEAHLALRRSSPSATFMKPRPLTFHEPVSLHETRRD